MNFKDIPIGKLIEQKVIEQKILISRICNFLNCEEEDVKEMYQKNSIDTYILLRWSKLLGYDFFRIYTQHLILYAPSSNENSAPEKNTKTQLPEFRKNIYTEEIKTFILEKINSKEMTNAEVVLRYNIPKSTLSKWIRKNNG